MLFEDATVQHDNTVQLEGRLLQLRPGPGGRSYTGLRVDVHAHLDGTRAVSYRGQHLATKLLPRGQHPSQRSKDRFPEGEPGPDAPLSANDKQPPRQTKVPPPDHPWRWGAAATARRKQLQIQGDDIFIEPLR